MSNDEKDANDIFIILKDCLSIWPATSSAYCQDHYKSLKQYAIRLAFFGMPPELVRSAMLILSAQEKYFPALSMILSTCQEIINNHNQSRIMDADEAWVKVIKTLKNGEKNVNWSKHIINAVEYVGGWPMIASCPNDQISVLRAHFRFGYEHSVKRENEDKDFQHVLSMLPEGTRQMLLVNKGME